MSRAKVSIEFDGEYGDVVDGVPEVEVGEPVTGRVTVTANESLKLNAINVLVGFRAHGRGDPDKVQTQVAGCAATSLQTGQTQTVEFRSVVPLEGPISWEGKVVKVTWEVAVHLDIPWATDQYQSIPFVVRPRGHFTRNTSQSR